LTNNRSKIQKAAEIFLLFAAFIYLCGGTKINTVLPNELTILMYHNLIDRGEPDELSISQKKFYEDMKWLGENGFHTILPNELCALRANGKPLPEKTVMVVFDDGYYSNYSLAFPVLKETGMKAAVMLITSQIKDSEPTNDPRVAMLCWRDVKEMSESGLIEFGSHSHNLHNPDQCGEFIPGKGKSNGIQRLRNETRKNYRIRLDADIKRSVSLIYEHTGQNVVSFAFPFGVADEWANDVLRQNGIRVTFLTGNQVADLGKGLFNLKRVGIHEYTDISKLLRAGASVGRL